MLDVNILSRELGFTLCCASIAATVLSFPLGLYIGEISAREAASSTTVERQGKRGDKVERNVDVRGGLPSLYVSKHRYYIYPSSEPPLEL
jgi:hypothetical protein